MPTLRLLPLLVSAAASLAIAGCARQADDRIAANNSTAPAAITWNDFEPAVFRHAADNNRIIIVDVGMEGCTACRWMDERTYTDPAVIARIDREFVAIQVDAEARPDLGERYEKWAWPATIFMNPKGEQVLAIRGNKVPKNFIPILDQLIEAHRAGTLEPDGSAPLSVPPNPDPADLGAIRARVVAQLDRNYNEQTHGWGRRMQYPLGVHVQHALVRAHARGSAMWNRRALETLDGYGALFDPVWGGVFVARLLDPEVRIIPEKRIAGQANALAAYALAYHRTGESRYLDHALEIDRYVRAFMVADDGGFFTSQEDDAPGLPQGLTALAYYETLGDQQRRAIGIPPIDHAMYTDKNARAIAAYVALFEASRRPDALALAVSAGEAMLARQGGHGLFAQIDSAQSLDGNKRMRPLPGGTRRYLAPQGPMGLALLDLYRATADRRWLNAATRLADGLHRLEDEQYGGWFATDDTSSAALVGRRKPVEANAMTARFVYELGVLTADESLRRRATRGVRAVSAPEAVRAEGRLIAELGLTLEWLATGAVEISVLGDPEDPQTQALYQAGLDAYEPRKVLHHQAPGRYPDAGHPVVYVCSDEACSQPIERPGAVAGQVAKFARNRAE